MTEVSSSERTTLVLNAAWLPIMLITARAAMNHMLPGRARALDKYGNLHYGDGTNNSWFPYRGQDIDPSIFRDDQPALTSKGEGDTKRYWPIPTIITTSTNFFFKPKTGKITLHRLAAFYGNRCQICGKKFPLRELTIEHVKPRSLDGSNLSDNLTLSCRSCNNKKGSTYPYFNARGEELKGTSIAESYDFVKQQEVREEWKDFIWKK